MPDSNIREAPTSFRHDGFEFRQLWREGAVAIYSQSRLGAPPVMWEVVIFRTGPAHPKDADQTPKERYPASSDWGRYGWSCATWEAAQARAARAQRECR